MAGGVCGEADGGGGACWVPAYYPLFNFFFMVRGGRTREGRRHAGEGGALGVCQGLWLGVWGGTLQGYVTSTSRTQRTCHNGCVCLLCLTVRVN